MLHFPLHKKKVYYFLSLPYSLYCLWKGLSLAKKYTIANCIQLPKVYKCLLKATSPEISILKNCGRINNFHYHFCFTII